MSHNIAYYAIYFFLTLGLSTLFSMMNMQLNLAKNVHIKRSKIFKNL